MTHRPLFCSPHPNWRRTAPGFPPFCPHYHRYRHRYIDQDELAAGSIPAHSRLSCNGHTIGRGDRRRGKREGQEGKMTLAGSIFFFMFPGNAIPLFLCVYDSTTAFQFLAFAVLPQDLLPKLIHRLARVNNELNIAGAIVL